MITSEADGTFTLSRESDARVLGRFRDDDIDGWSAWFEDGTETRRFLGTFENDDWAAAEIIQVAKDAGVL